MSTFEFLSHLKTLDIRVWAEGDRLRCSAPSNTLTPKLQEELRSRKTEILAFMQAAETWVESTSSLVPIQPTGRKPAFFGVAGHNGDTFCYVPLARHLGVDRPFYGLQPPGVDGVGAPLTAVEDLATHFVKDIRAFQPEGPYFVGGYCLGGIVAFEIAQQLRQQSREVALLALFGTPSPTSFHLSWRSRVAMQEFFQRVMLHVTNLRARSPRDWIYYVLDKKEKRREERQQSDNNLYRRQVEQATVRAVRTYEPRVYPGRIALFLPSDNPTNLFSDRLLDWQLFASDGVDLYTGPPDCNCNGDVMLREPHVKSFAELLRSSLNRDQA